MSNSAKMLRKIYTVIRTQSCRCILKLLHGRKAKEAKTVNQSDNEHIKTR